MRVLVALDGSERGERAVRSLKDWLGATDADVALLTVVNPDDIPQARATGGDNASGLARVGDEAERYLRSIQALDPGLANARTVVTIADNVASEIVRQAGDFGAEAIYLATRGRGGIGRTLLGSIAEQVVRQSTVPVIVAGPSVGRALKGVFTVAHGTGAGQAAGAPVAPAAAPAKPPESILTAIEALQSGDWQQRQRARNALVQEGERAVATVVALLLQADQETRLAAAQILGQIRSQASVGALVAALEDEDGSVRWAAADALVAIGTGSVRPVLRDMIVRADSPWTLEGAHHVLQRLVSPATSAVVQALEGPYPSITVPPLANEALDALQDAP